MREYWTLFGLHEDATADELKSAYRRFVKQWHPDRFAGDEKKRVEAEARLKAANLAYRVLRTYVTYRPPTFTASDHETVKNHGPARSAAAPPLSALQTEWTLTYLPLIVFITAITREAQQLDSFVIVLSAMLGISWSLMAWKVWHNTRIRPRQRIAWIVVLIVLAAISVPIYFARYERS